MEGRGRGCGGGGAVEGEGPWRRRKPKGVEDILFCRSAGPIHARRDLSLHSRP